MLCCAVLSHSVVFDSLRPHGPARLLCLWGFSRQEYWSGWSCPPPGDLPNPGIEPGFPTLQADSLPSEPLFLNAFKKNCSEHSWKSSYLVAVSVPGVVYTLPRFVSAATLHDTYSLHILCRSLGKVKKTSETTGL